MELKTTQLRRCCVKLKRCKQQNVENLIKVPKSIIHLKRIRVLVRRLPINKARISQDTKNSLITKRKLCKVHLRRIKTTTNAKVMSTEEILKKHSNNTQELIPHKNGTNSPNSCQKVKLIASCDIVSSTPIKANSYEELTNPCSRRPFNELNLRNNTKQKRIILKNGEFSGKSNITAKGCDKIKKLSLTKDTRLQNSLLRDKVQTIEHNNCGTEEESVVDKIASLRNKPKAHKNGANIPICCQKLKSKNNCDIVRSTTIKVNSYEELANPRSRRPLKELNNTKRKINILENCEFSGKSIVTAEAREKIKKLSLTKGSRLENHLLRDKVQTIEDRNCGTDEESVVDEPASHQNKPKEVFKSNGRKTKAVGKHLEKKGYEYHFEIRPIGKNTVLQKPFNSHKSRASPRKRKKLNEIPEKNDDNVYEFLSFSQSTEYSNSKNEDPAADIIKKLIDEGKVRVATRKKGTGKPIIKRNKLPAKQHILKKTQTNVLSKQSKQIRNKVYVSSIKSHPDMQDIDFHIVHDNIADSNPNKPNSVLTFNNSTNGSLSKLARAVMMSETRKKDTSRKKLYEQHKLLEAAQKFVSTPLVNYRKLSFQEKTPNLSPLYALSTRSHLIRTSPWRPNWKGVTSRGNSENLPTCSSDCIRPTPNKLKPNISINLTLSTPTAKYPVSSTIENKTLCSLFSSNKSNAVNIEPSALNEFDSYTEGNTSETNPPRKPLQEINILENISLPNWKSPNMCQQKSNENLQPSTLGLPLSLNDFDDYIEEKPTDTNTPRKQLPAANIVDNILPLDWNSPDIAHQKTNEGLQTSPCKENITYVSGLNEFFDDDSNEEQLKGLVDRTNCNENIRDKLHKLRYFNPNTILPQPAVKNTSYTFFDDDVNKKKGNQIPIKKIFSSTLIDEKIDDECNLQKIKFNHSTIKQKNEEPPLFHYPDAERTFDKKLSGRTYTRPFRKTKKLRHNFVMFLDSDGSGDDNNENQSNVEDAGHNKKKKTENPSSNVEFESFANEFNKMCSEVDQYELIVE